MAEAKKEGTESAEKRQYAVVKSGGRLYKVTSGSRVTIGNLDGEKGATITLGDVLLIGTEGGTDVTIGAPLIDGAKVTATILGQKKDKKVIIFKKRRRKGYTKKQGHRQLLTEVVIDSIVG